MIPIEQQLVETISERTSIGHMLIDEQLRVRAAHDIVALWLQRPQSDLLGQSLPDLMPVFVGVEPLLHAIIQGRRQSFSLPRVKYLLADGRDLYLDLHVEPFRQFGAVLLLSLLDVTQATLQEQMLLQQRNELGLLSAQLSLAREQLGFVLERFVPTEIAQDIVARQHLPAPGGIQHCQATVLFADMRDFTKVAETHSPRQTLDILNAYLTVIIDAIQTYQGSIIQIVGDMIMATFNVPQVQEDHILRGIQAALYTAKTLTRFTDNLGLSEMPKLGFGIGICSGSVTAGYLGAAQRYRYAVVGDVTNVAFHLCARARAGQVLVTESTLHLAMGEADSDWFTSHFLEYTALKRRRELVAVYEVREK